MSAPKIPNRVERVRIAAQATVDERTVVAVYKGKPVRTASFERVCAAAKKLGLPVPEKE